VVPASGWPAFATSSGVAFSAPAPNYLNMRKPEDEEANPLDAFMAAEVQPEAQS